MPRKGLHLGLLIAYLFYAFQSFGMAPTEAESRGEVVQQESQTSEHHQNHFQENHHQHHALLGLAAESGLELEPDEEDLDSKDAFHGYYVHYIQQEVSPEYYELRPLTLICTQAPRTPLFILFEVFRL
ncbi:MAG: hypothetical protein EP338_13850 [Bacteroidetes bacterium]|nr:MAG: hypothetical protein EP338_13850 [Bacteroidota bacterium]